MVKIFIGLTLLFSSVVKAERTIRFWEGERNNRPEDTLETPDEAKNNYNAHLEFIRNSLGPATVVAGQGALDYYAIYIPSQKPFAEPAAIDTLPFTEAALPSYYCQAAYDAARTRRPLYGPLHSKIHGFGSPTVSGIKRSSYSSVPKVFEDSELAQGILISDNKLKDRSDRVAYDLTPRNQLNAPNWQSGFTVVWLQIRKPQIDESVYKKTLAKMFQKLVNVEGPKEANVIDGHFVRVDKGHVLHFIHVPTKTAAKLIHSGTLLKELENITEPVLFTHENVIASSMEPFYAKNPRDLKEPNWDSAIAPGKAVVVRFKPRSVLEVLSPNELKKDKSCERGL